jgi:hypothetical protein
MILIKNNEMKEIKYKPPVIVRAAIEKSQKQFMLPLTLKVPAIFNVDPTWKLCAPLTERKADVGTLNEPVELPAAI